MRNSYLRIITLSLSLFFCSRIYSQYYEWAFALTNNYGAAIIRDIAHDASGNVYIVGRFKGTLDLDPSGSTNNVSTPTTGTYDYDTFVAKYNSSGAYQLGFRVGGTADDEPFSIEVDGSGNIFISGVAGSTNADFDPSGNTANPSTTGNYIAKYNSSGAYQWVNTFNATIKDMKVDGSSNIYITGTVSSGASGGAVDFDPSGNNSNHSVSNDNNATQDKSFIAKYNSSGAYQWAGIIADGNGNGESKANGIDVDDSGNVYVTGYFSTGNNNSSDFDPSGSSANLTSNGVDDMFVAKYNSSGAYLWVRGFGDDINDNSGYDHGFDIIVDGTGNVHVGGGKFTGTIDFDPSGSTANHTLSNDGIILKLDTSGEYLWSKAIKNENGIQVRRIDIDGSGNVYAFAEFQIDASFDSSGSTIKPVDYSSGNSGNDMGLFAKWGSDGTYKWAKWFNGSSSPSLEHEAIALNGGNIYLGGYFTNTIDFDPSSSTANISGGGGFLAKYNQAPQVSSVTSTTSDGYYNEDDVIAIKINFTETVIVSGTPQLTLETGSSDAVVNYSSGSNSSALIFNYTVASGHTSSDLDYLSTTALSLNSGTIKNSSNTAADLTLPSPGAGNSLGANKALVIDTTVPTVSSVSSTKSNGTYNVGESIPITITFNETVVVTGTPQLTLETGSSDAVVDYTSGSNSSVLTFNYTVANNQTSSDLDYVNTSSLALNSGTIKDLAGNNATLTLASPGATNSLGANKGIIIASSVISLTSTSNNGTYKIGDVIPIQINFSGNVIVSGTPQLTLETGSSDAVINYSSGSNSSSLIFNYTIASSDTSSDLDYKTTGSLLLNSGTIRDLAGNNATLTLPNPGATNSLGANKALVIDGFAPTVSYVSSSNNNGTYKTGDAIAITITFSQNVIVDSDLFQNDGTGRPRLTLETGSDDQGVNYSSGSGGSTLTWNYTVASGNQSSDLDYKSTSALALNSGTIKDAAGNNAILTLPEPGKSNSLGVNKSIVIDGVVPTITFSPANSASAVQLNTNITLTFSEAVRKTDDIALSNTNVDALITLKDSNSSGSDIAFDATINSGKTIITIDPTNDFSSEQVVYVAIGATVEDGAGNTISAANATFTGADINATVVNFSPANGASNVSTSSDVTISFNEAVRKIDDSAITNTNVDALITLKDSNSSGSDIAFDATINAGKTLITINPTNDFSSSQVVYVAIGATVEDDANNAITAISSSFTVADIVRPTITSGSLSTDNSYLDITMNEGVYNANGGSGALEKTDFTLTFDQNSGNATAASIISIKNNSNSALSGGESVIRANLSITGTPSGVETVAILPASSTSIYDASGNAMATTQTTGSKTLNDKLAPVFASEYPKVANVSGTSFDILVKINEEGKCYYVILANGATAPTAVEVKAGTGNSAATAIKSGNFALTKDTEKSEGITGLTAEMDYDVYVLTQDGEITPNIQANPTKLEVSTGDIILPVVNNISSTVENATYITVGDTIPITITFSEIVIVTGIPQLTIETGANDALANYDIGSGSDSLIFNYIIASGDTSNDLSYVSSSALILNSGTIKDEAANEAILALPEPGTTNSLSANKAIVIDAMPAMVLSVSSTSIDSIYKLGSEIPILVRFSEMVKVEGVPQIILSTGSPGDSVNYFSGSSTNELIFKYIISSGDYSSDLDYKDKTSLILNSGTIKDVAGNDAILNLVAPGVENSLGASKQLIIDGIVPSIPWVYEGSISTDLDYQNDPSNLTLTWSEAEDAFFDTMHYEYSIGITKGGTEIKGWTNSNGQLSVQLSDLNLIENVTYYSGVKAIDGAGNISPVLQSDGITIDKTSPLTSSINDGLNEDIDISNSGKTISANWLQFSDATSYIKEYEYAVGTTANGIDIKTWTSIGVDTSFVDSSFQLIHAQNYFVSVKATDAADNISKTVSSDGFKVDLYPGAPSVSSISLPNGSYLPLIDDIAITIDFSESISDYELSMSSKLNNSVNNSHSKDVNQINLNIIAPLTSLDTLSLSISNVTDLVGNVSENIEYQFSTSLIGDFTGDKSIDGSDIIPFITGWNNKDITYELGPVVGKPPHFTIQKDGKYDLRDLMALTRIWDWSQASLSKSRARQFEQIGDSINHNVLDKNISLYIPTKVSAIDLLIDYPIQDVRFESLENITTPQKVFLSHHDTTNSLIKIAAGYLESKSKMINLPYHIFGKENIPININYRMLDHSGYIVGQGERTIQLIAIPNEFRLHQNYPNPFNPLTTINYDLPSRSRVNLVIYDIMGREVITLLNEERNEGYHSIIWNTRNNVGTPVSAGVYLYQLQAKDFVKTRKMILLK